MTAPRESSSVNGIQFNVLNGISLFLISASVIFLQIVLMRSLAITRYHHFSYLVISTALLGFGASGTFLALFSKWVREQFMRCSALFYLLFLISTALSYYLAESIPLDVQYMFYSLKQVLFFVIYNFLLFIPFFFGAVIIGAYLVYFKGEVPAVYGVNLFGSGAGGLLAIGALFIFPATKLPAAVSGVSLIALFLWLMSSKIYVNDAYRRFSLSVLIVGCIATAVLISVSPPIHIDQYKMLSYLQQLEQQGEATRSISSFNPRSRIDVYGSDMLHQTLFAGLNTDAISPPQMVILRDGQYAGSIFRISSADEARILDFTPQSVPFRMIEAPRVLLLGEVGGVNVWLAKRFGADRITVVQADPKINRIMRFELSQENGGVYNLGDVEVVTKEPYLFLEQTDELFDIIQIVSAEGMSAGVSGLQSLHEDYMLTVESVMRCFDRLTERGFLSVTRGVQSPPRDNIKIFSLFREALERSHVRDIDRHLLQSRNYLAMNTLMSREPLSLMTIEQYRGLALKLQMDTEFHPGIESERIEQWNRVDGPEGKPYSYFHYGAMKILSDERSQFFREWAYAIRPPDDNIPYFYDFFKWGSLARFFESYGRQWFQMLELGYVVLVLAFVEIVIMAFLFIIMPLLLKSTRLQEETGKFPVFIYFLCLGLGFMFIEMVFIQKFTRFMGSPLYSVTVALTSILIFAGLGSLYQRKRSRDPLQIIRIAVTGILVSSGMYIFALDPVLSNFIAFPVAVRFFVTVVLLAPVSFFMGWMFPVGLTILEDTYERLVPWAWGVNGFASVSAAPLAVLLSMSYGFRSVLIMALILYITAGSVAGLMKENKKEVS